jgi:alginate O-acetyltransferase complex protein AlgI
MLFQSYELFIGVLVGAALYSAVRNWMPAWNLLRNILLLAINVLVLLTLVKEHTLIVLAALGSITYFLGKLLANKSAGKAMLTAGIAGLILLFAMRNYPYLHPFLGAFEGPVLSVQKLGLSYILFRWIHFLMECHRQTITQSTWLNFLNYTFFFPTILAGPIDQYKNFHYGVEHRARGMALPVALAGVWRVGLGAFKTLVLVPVVRPWAMDWQDVPVEDPIAAMVLGLASYSAFILLDFSGYCDIAIGTAKWMGIRTPENFDWPYAAKNLAEFWRRWHMTFSNFLRAYVFLPIIKGLNQWGALAQHRLFVTALAYLLTFIVCGLWHGDRLHFVLWGGWHGVGLIFSKVWRERWRSVQWSGRWADALSIAGTWIFVTLGWGLFHYPLEAWEGWITAVLS